MADDLDAGPTSIEHPRSIVHRVMVGTNRSSTADEAVRWAAALADQHDAELLVVQVMSPDDPSAHGWYGTEPGAGGNLSDYVAGLAGARGRGRIAVDEDPVRALLSVADEEGVDTLVVGNVGMRGRKEFLLENVPNRISHNARCNVIIVNTAGDGGPVAPPHVDEAPVLASDPRLIGRAAHVGAVMAKHGVGELRTRRSGADTPQLQAQRLRRALEELGPTFEKLGQVLSTRPDLVPPAFIDELSKLQDHVTPLTEAEVVTVMEEDLGVPWEDVFDRIDATPLAAGTIAQVHRAILETGQHVVVKVQRPTARSEIAEDLALLEMFVAKTEHRALFRRVIDMKAVFTHLSDSLERELDFRREASNIARMARILEPYSRLGVPAVHEGLTTSRLLVMQEIEGIPVRDAPEGPARKEAARQLLESYYQQIVGDGFFHADPHPGNLMWWNDRIYLLDFGMVGELGRDEREMMMLLLMAFWQEDVGFLMDVIFILTGSQQRSDVDVVGFREELGGLLAKYRKLSLREIQLGPILQEMSEIAIRYEVPLPASMTLTAKAMAQMQQTAAELDPGLDPFEVAGSFLMRTMTARIRETLHPRWIFFESQKLRMRLIRLVEAFERLTGARPGEKLQVNFRAEQLEHVVRQAGKRISLGATASAAILGAARIAAVGVAPTAFPLALGGVGSALALRLLVDLLEGDA